MTEKLSVHLGFCNPFQLGTDIDLMAKHRLSLRTVATASAGKFEERGGLRLVVSKAGAEKGVPS